MTGFVIDASVAVKWVVTENDSEIADSLRSRKLPPSLWLLECANVLWVKARRGELRRDQALSRQRLLQESPILIVPVERLTDEAVVLAHQLDVTPYDAAYLSLARQRRQPLVTADKKLQRRVIEGEANDLTVLSLADL